MEDILVRTAHYLLNQSCQIAALFVVVVLACRALRGASAHWRYLLWLVVLAKCLFPPVVGVPRAILSPEPAGPAAVTVASGGSVVFPPRPPSAQPLPEDRTPARAGLTAPHNATISEDFPSLFSTADVAPAPVTTAPLSSSATQAVPWLAAAWVAGVAVFGLVVLLKARRLNRKLKRTRRPVDGKLADVVSELASGTGLKKAPKAYLVEGTSQPFVWGWMRGSVYLPAAFANPESPAARRGIIAHELAHVARCDAAVNAAQVVAQTLFFFHPLVWLANRGVRRERKRPFGRRCRRVTVPLMWAKRAG